MSGCCDACVHVEYGIGAYCTRDQRKWIVIDEPEADNDCQYYECRFPKAKVVSE